MGISIQDGSFLIENYPTDLDHIMGRLLESFARKTAREKLVLSDVILMSEMAKNKKTVGAYKKWIADQRDTTKGKDKKRKDEKTVFQKLRETRTFFQKVHE